MIYEDDLILEDEEKEEDGASMNGILIGILTKGLIDARTILISDSVDHKLTAKVTAQLLFLDHQDSEKSIKIFINSPGGSVYDGFAILRYDSVYPTQGEDNQRGSVGQCCDGDFAGSR